MKATWLTREQFERFKKQDGVSLRANGPVVVWARGDDGKPVCMSGPHGSLDHILSKRAAA